MLFLIALCLSFAVAFLWQESREKYTAAVVLKGLASLCFVALGLLCSDGTQLARLVVFGLVLGCIADVLLNLRWVFPKTGQLIFLVGILVFLSGHILYLAAILPLSAHWAACFAIGAILTALLMVWIFKRITAKRAFKIFGVFYIGAIMLLNCTAVGNLLAAPSAFTGLFATGALLFLVSDIVLILNTFGAESRQSLRITNIGLYYVGQLLIALSLRFLASG
ncbi:MAG: lysoplasmalogenase [Oscillospiraceae bacterium]|jgi:Predicted membrane protein|nr:lysoplasmalogenase [Oscillospiraceae bacterium]MBR6839420.1 lysoplasmalogenase [Oscillospiraceae bacterium]